MLKKTGLFVATTALLSALNVNSGYSYMLLGKWRHSGVQNLPYGMTLSLLNRCTFGQNSQEQCNLRLVGRKGSSVVFDRLVTINQQWSLSSNRLIEQVRGCSSRDLSTPKTKNGKYMADYLTKHYCTQGKRSVSTIVGINYNGFSLMLKDGSRVAYSKED